MRIGIVIQRYGVDIVGGSEFLCRQFAEHLAKQYQIDVLTTCAKDYVTWKNEYSPGRSRINGVTVMRFENIQSRNLDEFNKYSEWIYNNAHSVTDELNWLEQQGPVCPELINYIKTESRNYQLMIFYTYLYYPTYHGIAACQSKSILVPTAHNEPPIKLSIYKDIFSKTNAIIFNTFAERSLVQNLFDVDSKITSVIGTGIRIHAHLNRNEFKKKNGLDRDYIVFGGRIDAGKGCKEMIDFFLKYRDKHADYPMLVLFGKLEMPLPPTTDIMYVGYVPEQEKTDILAGARVVVVPSAYESLSLILLEAFSCAVPGLVNASSAVLLDHCTQSNAALYYANYNEFEQMLYVLLHDYQLRSSLARNAFRYIRNNYNWAQIIKEYTSLINQLSR
jgi:glycosyltransferase involved in cell wall biosynthesis